ncbi:MAG TPA: phosphoenolpyruvate--protein phosphotransferase [Burkholderiales bacterium]|jgi:phosphotransferase system enzyme I (PtsI)|nr:phosphoenolpyruvate--protein phosphotransferase [Burkholderiales bacterium]
MSFTIHGIGISGGVAIGRAQLVSHAQLEVAHYDIPKSRVAQEKARFDAAVTQVRSEFAALSQHVPAGAPPEFAAFLNLHRMILDDPTLSEAPKTLIESQSCNAEWALKLQMEELLDQFASIEDGYLRERRNDIIQVVEQVLKALMGQPGRAVRALPGGNAILVAHDLSPADVILFKQHQFASFITDLGGATSHTAIVARSLNIPSVVALHHARTLIRENELLIVDGSNGVVIVNPDKTVLGEYKLRQEQWEIERQKLKRLKRTRTTTLDGTPIELQANIELPEDVADAKENGAEGIGLFRTEFLFLNRRDLPSEDEQFDAYRRVVTEMDGMPVTIRTFDLGADKQLDAGGRVTPNPALGLRAIRLCLAEPHMFHRQLRAILRASHYGKVKLLIPMLSSIAELNQTLHLVQEAKASLERDGIPYDRKVQVGGMIEVPAAALSLNMFMRRLDFISIGTNDLIQYTLAIDRSDDSVSHLYDPLHPAVLNLLSHIIRSANRAGKPVAICGEMAGDVKLVRLLLGLGLRQLSMHPAYLLAVKQVVLKTDLPEILVLTQKMLRSDEPDRLSSLLARMNR